mgnify:CR=1 FL=1
MHLQSFAAGFDIFDVRIRNLFRPYAFRACRPPAEPQPSQEPTGQGGLEWQLRAISTNKYDAVRICFADVAPLIACADRSAQQQHHTEPRRLVDLRGEQPRGPTPGTSRAVFRGRGWHSERPLRSHIRNQGKAPGRTWAAWSRNPGREISDGPAAACRPPPRWLHGTPSPCRSLTHRIRSLSMIIATSPTWSRCHANGSPDVVLSWTCAEPRDPRRSSFFAELFRRIRHQTIPDRDHRRPRRRMFMTPCRAMPRASHARGGTIGCWP